MSQWPPMIRELPTGGFCGAYTLLCAMTEAEMQFVVKWLCKNLRENFVLHKITKQLVAGGFTNNEQAYDLGYFTPTRASYLPSPSAGHYELKLVHPEDQALLELTWGDRILED